MNKLVRREFTFEEIVEALKEKYDIHPNAHADHNLDYSDCWYEGDMPSFGTIEFSWYEDK
jgi:hypothetical protein